METKKIQETLKETIKEAADKVETKARYIKLENIKLSKKDVENIIEDIKQDLTILKLFSDFLD